MITVSRTSLEPPGVLDRVPRKLIRLLEVSELLRDVLLATKHPNADGHTLALMSLDSYFHAARHEHRAIQRSRTRTGKGQPGVHPPQFHHVHFYLICCSRIGKLAKFIIEGNSHLRRAKLVRKAYLSRFDDWISFRDHMEHFEERLPGRGVASKMRDPNDLGNLWGENFSFGGRRVNVGHQSVEHLANFVTAFREALKYDAVEALANKDMDCLWRHLLRAAQNVHLAKVVKEFKADIGRQSNQRLASSGDHSES